MSKMARTPSYVVYTDSEQVSWRAQKAAQMEDDHADSSQVVRQIRGYIIVHTWQSGTACDSL